MAKRVGTWWIKDGLDARRVEAQGFGEVLELLSTFNWTQDHGDANPKAGRGDAQDPGGIHRRIPELQPSHAHC